MLGSGTGDDVHPEFGGGRRGFISDFDAWLTARGALLTDMQTEITVVHASLIAEHVRQRRQNRRGGPGSGGFGGR